MKRFALALCFLLILSGIGPVPSARAWWWHHHHKNAPAERAPKQHKEKTHRSWFHHEKAPGTGDKAATNGPRSIGHWHPQPGPAGYGAN